MSSLPARIQSYFSSLSVYLQDQLNFFRIHLLVYTLTPLVFSGVFYASNSENHISYVDSLFNCVSAMTVCGLATVDLSLLTNWQQGILFVQMCIGSPVLVSWVMVLIRRHFLAKELKNWIEAGRAERVDDGLAAEEISYVPPLWKRIISRFYYQKRDPSVPASNEDDESRSTLNKRDGGRRLRPDMIRRMNDVPKLITPSGWISEGRMSEDTNRSASRSRPSSARQMAFSDMQTQSPLWMPAPSLRSQNKHGDFIADSTLRASRRLSDSGASSDVDAENLHRSRTIDSTDQTRGPSVMRSQTVEFAPSPPRSYQRADRRRNTADPVATEESRLVSTTRPRLAINTSTTSLHSHYTMLTSKNRDYGGFPMPHKIILSIIHRFFPKVENKLKRTLTMPAAQTITSQYGAITPGSRPVPYITFDAIVGRNSTFHMLSSEQIEELCGVEFKALNVLLWIVPLYHITVQLLSFVVIASYISIGRWSADFNYPKLHRHIAPPWFALFQVVSSYTNAGMSLVDQSMIPFQRAYPMIVVMIFLIFAGNTCFPIFLRLTIWTISKSISAEAKLNEPLTFLLDHPRRCFIYLFPSHQTWFLLTIVLMLTFTDWFFFLVLDIGNKALSSIPTGVKVIIGLLQAAAVRAAGFSTIPLYTLAPAVKVLYTVMMFVSVYPIAMSIRSTNVYEEKSLGVFADDDESIDESFKPMGTTATVWSRYLALHMRKQLSFDMWWLALALFLVCIIERPVLDDPANATWFNIFDILFELVSAYGTVGLSLGLPFANHSFCGAFKPLSKLILCLVMIRGRHRGLPVAIDRAVMLPDLQAEDQKSFRRRTTFPAHGGDGHSLRQTSTIPPSSNDVL